MDKSIRRGSGARFPREQKAFTLKAHTRSQADFYSSTTIMCLSNITSGSYKDVCFCHFFSFVLFFSLYNFLSACLCVMYSWVKTSQ